MVQPSILDKVATAISPSWGASRLKSKHEFSALSGAYNGASRTRRSLKSWLTRSGDADSDLAYDVQTLRARSSDLIRNSAIASGALKTLETSIIGSGLKYQSEVDYKRLGITREAAKKWERKAEFYFHAWAKSKECDASRQCNFYQMQKLVYRSVFERGDVFVGLPMFKREGSGFGLKLQVIEADRVSNKDNAPNSVALSGGVERDSRGAPLFYHVMKHHPYGVTQSRREWKRVRAFGRNTGRPNMLHVYDVMRAGQTRGIPALSAIIESLKQLETYTNAELMAAVVSGLFTVAITSESSDTMGQFQADNTVQDGGQDYQLGNGAILQLGVGEKVDNINPARPNAQFSPFVDAIIRQIGMALGCPFEILTKHFASSYSASQAALLEGWRFFYAEREKYAEMLCQPVLESFIGELVASGKLEAPSFFDDPLVKAAYCGSKWVGRPMGHIREDVSIKAAKMRIEQRLSTRQIEAAKISGGDWENMNEQLLHEETMIPIQEDEQTVMPSGGK